MRKHGLTIDNLLAAEILTALAEPVADLLRPMRYSELFPDEPRSPMAW